MRFNKPDTMSPFGKGGVNAYAYCQGDPVNYQDPTGHIPGLYIQKYTSRLNIFRNRPIDSPGSPRTIKDALDANPKSRLLGYYFEAETETAVSFRAKSVFTPGEYRPTLAMGNNLSRNSSSTHFWLDVETFEAGTFMLKDDVVLSGFSADGNPAPFESLAPYMDELIELGFQKTTISSSSETGYRLTPIGFMENSPTRNLGLHQVKPSHIRK